MGDPLPAEDDLANAGRDGSGAAGHIVGHEDTFSVGVGNESHEYIYVYSHIIMFLREVSESTPRLVNMLTISAVVDSRSAGLWRGSFPSLGGQPSNNGMGHPRADEEPRRRDRRDRVPPR